MADLTPEQIERERVAFEAEMHRRYPVAATTDRALHRRDSLGSDRFGEYCRIEFEMAWSGWLARASSPLVVPAEPSGASPAATTLSAPALRASAPIVGANTRCDGCKHWDLDIDYPSMKVGRCRTVPMLWGSTQWTERGDMREWTKEGAAVTAFAQDGSDYLAYLYTKAEHSCSMFARRIVTPQGANPEGIEPGPAGTRPGESASRPDEQKNAVGEQEGVKR